MRFYLNLLFLIAISFPCFAQQYQLNLENAYGEGAYQAGDTVIIFSRALAEEEYFQGWNFSEENIQFVFDAGEWRTQFLMPAKDLLVKATIGQVPSDFLKFEEIMGQNILKPVYYAFPENSKGTVFFFHGTGGSVNGWIGLRREQNFSLVKECYAAGYGVIITESEESTLGMDLNDDENIRWQPFPLSFNENIDYQNLFRIIQEFENRGLVDRERLFSVGMSNGGAFSGSFSLMFNTQASVIYCAASNTVIAENTEAPLLFCMMPNDVIIREGGNEEALLNSNTLGARGICSDYFMNKTYPIYPAYFARMGISTASSSEVFKELQINGFIDSAGYTLQAAEALQESFLSAPLNWPIIRGLPSGSAASVRRLFNLADGGHVFYANHNKRTIAFLDQACTEVVTNNQYSINREPINVFPNPATDQLQIAWPTDDLSNVNYQILDLWGRVQQSGKIEKGTPISLSDITRGYYLLKLDTTSNQYWGKFLKLEVD